MPLQGLSSTETIAALTLVRYPWRNVYGALAAMGLDRLWLRRTPGLRFWRLMGSARGPAFGAWEPHRYGLFSVWDSPAALDAFEHRSPVMAAYRRRADEIWTVRLAPLRWHGAWGGADPFAGVQPAEPPPSGPWAILTRATIQLRHLRTFRSAAPPVTAALTRHPGLIASIGLGETPLRAQATFSLWSDLRAAQDFAYTGAEHAAVIRRTRVEGWYSEELFARFRPIRSYGVWDGRDPLQR